MKLQNLTVIFIIIIIPVILLLSLYISTGIKTIKYQSLYDDGLLTATHDAIYAFEQNTANINLSGNPEIKRSILNSSVKMFEKSLCNTCNISAYNTDEIERYIPAIVFGMYDGFYMYTPSYNPQKNEYEHNLKNYVYYSETLYGIGESSSDVVIRYSLDNYVTISGDFEGDSEGYILKSGYLMNINGSTHDGKKYKGIEITAEDIDGDGTPENNYAINYYEKAYDFTKWFNDYVGDKVEYLNIESSNDPEDEASKFVQHKRTVIKQKIEGVLNSSITAYSQRALGRAYKMPKLKVEDWEKIYNNISMITFFQGKKIGLTNYNGYCVLNSTNNKEYVNPNLMYFIEGADDTNHYYHDIRCSQCESASTLTGYKIGAFMKQKLEVEKDAAGNTIKDASGRIMYNNNGTLTTSPYKYNHKALACYECINGPLNTNKSIYEYIWGLGNNDEEKNIKSAYWTSLGRERYNQVHL